MDFLAHSARPERGIPAQGYGAHVAATRELAGRYAEDCGRHSPEFGAILTLAARLAGEFHDIGKLDDANQTVLAGVSRSRLPVPHEDAGAAHLLKSGGQAGMYAALAVHAHHRGLPSIPRELNRGSEWFRAASAHHREQTDARLVSYLERHRECLGLSGDQLPIAIKTNRLQILWRILLSCLADADHGDTACHYGQPPLPAPLALRPVERLAALDAYVAGLGRDERGPRDESRGLIYQACRHAAPLDGLCACDAPVGSGKTTAIMASLLKTASERGLRRLFVVLPYTNIIRQSVDVYRSAIVLPGEDPNLIVAEHHHRAEYGAPESRRLAMSWAAPIVVTTAVQFFETLASNSPAGLRKLHHLPGAAVFIDEAHAALPAHLWPQAWLWLDELSDSWGCRFVLASGSLSRFWELDDFHSPRRLKQRGKPVLRELIPESTRRAAAAQEVGRVTFRTLDQPLSLAGLLEKIQECHSAGPRLIVMNTVQSAAVVARDLRERVGDGMVEHLSTALTPRDREATLSRVIDRLKSRDGSNWALVATSCVEAGVDLSFAVGFRERASLMSLLQLAGRVNRHGKLRDATVWDFRLIPGDLLRENPGLRVAGRVLGELFGEGHVGPEWCTEALRREVRWGEGAMRDELLRAESSEDASGTDFPRVAELFNVIDRESVTVVISTEVQEKLRRGLWCGPDELQRHSVQIWGRRAEQLGLEEFPRFPGVFGWRLPYDEFLGFMAGLLPVVEFERGVTTVI